MLTPAAPKRSSFRLTIGSLLPLLLLGSACTPPSEEAARRSAEATPVVLISIDTLRADRLPAYGYDRVATPAIDAFRRDAILFERAYSHYPLTLPSHVSALTGLLPSEHGVRDNLGYELEVKPGDPYLPRILKRAGYRTGAAVSSYVLRGETGLDADFDAYDANIELLDTDRAEGLGEVQRAGAETVAAALGWLEEVSAEPFFLFLHLYEPHTPYAPAEPFASRYDDPYDGEIATVDEILGSFLDRLRQLKLYDRSLILLFSDHGEGLGDHVEEEHGFLLYREAIEVPMILKLPHQERAGGLGTAPVQLIDVVPTILACLGLPPEEGLRGSSLLEMAADDAPSRPIYAETYYPRLHMGWSELTSLIQGDDHFIDGPDPELYDLGEDPGETSNLLRAERRKFRQLRAELAAFVTPLRPPTEVDAETRERLESLGYLSSTAKLGDGPLPDPKGQMHTLERFGEAMRLVQNEEYEAALPRLEALVAEYPGMQDAWQALALGLRSAGRYPEALRAYDRLLELIGPQAHVVLGLAGLYLKLGDLSRAASHAELALEDDPVGARLILAEVALLRDELELAEGHARQAVAARKLAVAPLIRLAKILSHRGSLDEARTLLTQIDQEMQRRTSPQPLADLHFIRGDLLARRGDLAAAEAAFEAELEAHPENLDAFARLVFLRAGQGRAVEATELLRRMVEDNPYPAAYAVAVRTLHLLGDDRQAAALLSYALARFPDTEALRNLTSARANGP